MKIPSSRLPVPLLLPFISPPRNSFSHKVKTKGGQGDLDHVFLEFYLWYCTLNYFEKYFTPTTLRTGKITHFLKKKKKRKSKQECVCVAWRGIIWEVQTLKNSISSPPPPPKISAAAEPGDEHWDINNWQEATVGYQWIFFIYIYLRNGVYFMKWNV